MSAFQGTALERSDSEVRDAGGKARTTTGPRIAQGLEACQSGHDAVLAFLSCSGAAEQRDASHSHTATEERYFSPVGMKRLFQLVTLLVIAIMATQPALAAYAVCGASSTRHACCQHSAVAPHSAINALPLSPTVGRECCPLQMTCAIPDASRQASAVPITKSGDGTAAIVAVAPVAQPSHAAPPVAASAPAPLARYVLFRAFRI